jgi:hypothetical protein
MVVVSAAPADGKVLARQYDPTPVAGYGGRLVWSRYDARHKLFRLVSTRVGRTRTLPVPPRDVPFDVELGETASGEQLAVYSRCRGGENTFLPYRAYHGCRLYRYSFDLRHEKPWRMALPRGVVSAFLPTISHGHLAFAARRRDGDVAMYVGHVGSWVRVSIARPGADDPLIGTRHGDAAGPTRLALRDGTLAYTWEYSAQRADCGADSDSDPNPNSMLVVRAVDGGQRVVAHGNCAADGETHSVDQVQWVDDHTVRYLAASTGYTTDIRRVDLLTAEANSWTSTQPITSYAADGRGHALGSLDRVVITMPVLPPTR